MFDDTKTKLRPKHVFLVVLAMLYLLLTLVDVLHQTTDGPNMLDLGNLLLAQSLAFFITTLVVIMLKAWRNSVLPWLAGTLGCLVLVVVSYLIFYNFPRIATEADGPASVYYTCMLGEKYSTITSLTGESADDHSTTAKLCVLKNAPLSASNILFVDNDAEASGLLLFVIGEGMLFSGIVIVKRFVAHTRVTCR